MHARPRRLVALWIAWRIPLLAAAAVLAVVAMPAAGRLAFDRSIENMFAPGDPILPPFRKLQRTFGGNEIVLAVYEDPGLLSPDGEGIRRLGQVRRRLQAVAGVADVLSLDRPLGEAIVGPSPVARRMRELFEGYTHGTDGTTVSIGCMLRSRSESGVAREETIEAIRGVVAELPSGTIAGEPVMLADGFNFVEQDGLMLGWASTTLLAAVILLCFRSLRWVLLPLAVVQWAVLLTRAGLVWSGLRLSMVSSMLTAVITIVGIGAIVHVVVRFREARADGLSPPDALASAADVLAKPIFWSLATDAVGFGSLMLNRVGPIADFGLMMVLGSAVVLVSMAMLIPGGVLLGRFDRDPRRAWGEGHLEMHLDRLVRLLRRHPASIGLATLGLTAAAIAGSWRLEVETDFTRNFRESSSVVRSYELIENRLGGAGVWDVMLPAPKQIDWDYVQRVRRLESRLRSEAVLPGPEGSPRPALTKVLSLADLLVAGSPVDLEKVDSPPARNLMLAGGLGVISTRMPVFTAALFGPDPAEPGRYWFRVMLRAKERQPAADKELLIRRVKEIVDEEFPEEPGAEVTGYFVLLTNLIHSILRDQWITFAVATLGIWLMMVFALKKLSHSLIALVPNAAPIMAVTGMVGWLGLKINLGAAMIAAVSMGLSIDSSIHYLLGYQRARSQGASVAEALSGTQRTVGRALVLSTLALVAGFLVLVGSQFVPTIYFGVLVSLTMLGGLAGNLVALPLLISITERDAQEAT